MTRGAMPLEQPVVVGILNITPNSFSDGGRFLDPAAALQQATLLLEQGADMLDLGAESTRPGRPEPVAPAEEWRRLEPVLRGLAERDPGVPLSVDTVKAETASRALAAGAWAVNDVSGLRLDPEIADVCAEHGAGLVLMHSRGSLSELAGYNHASYGRVVDEVVRELERALEVAGNRGVGAERVVLDPGLGFAKRPEHNYEVLRDLPALVALGHPVMVGPSRSAAAYLGGASLFRVHAVAPVREALAIAHAIRST
jgi:dihydropteroate synthase